MPFGPSAAPEGQEPTTGHQARGDGVESPLSEEPSRSVSPEDFWGEHSASVQDTLDRRDAAAARLASMRARVVPRVGFGSGELRRPVVAAGATAVLALLVVGYLTLLSPSGGPGRSPIAATLGPSGQGTSSPWAVSRPRLPTRSVQGGSKSSATSHRARHGIRAIPVRYAPKTSPQGPSTRAVSATPTSQSPATVPVVTTTSPAPSTTSPPPQTRQSSRSSSRSFGAHGVLGPGHSRSG